ncbi:MAG: endopeptidase IV [Legionella sp.]|nr:endopeptidase IV [Legionella sp.]
MKSLVPWFCLVAAAGSQALHAADGLEAYRQGNYTLAAEHLNAELTKDPVANYYLGLMRLYGYGQLKNNEIALRYFNQAAQSGYLPAQLLLARYYLVSAGDPALAFQWFKKAADKDDMTAQMYVAAAYLFGYGVKQNPDASRRYYIEAAKDGNDIAQYALGENFLESRDNRNKKMGLIWLGKSAEKGNAKAQLKLGNMYATGGFVSRDPVKAKELLEKAAAQNSPAAMVSLGELAKKEGQFQQAHEWLLKAANEKYIPAQFALAQLFMEANSPIYDGKSGFLWMLKAAEGGSYDAELALSKMYKEGQGVPVDPNLAEEWHQKAVKTAALKPASLDAKIAVAKWLSNDKSESLAESGYRLGGIYNAWKNPLALKENNYNQPPQMGVITRQELYKPQFVLVNPDEIPISDYFDALAPTLSDSGAWTFPRYHLDEEIEALLRDESLVLKHDKETSVVDANATYPVNNELKPFDYVDEKTTGWEHQSNFQAVLSKLYGQAILGESSAQFELGQLYQYGIGVAQNIDQAITYFQLAAVQQDIRAEYNLGVIYLEGKTSPVDYQKGIEWMTDAAFKGNSYAQYVLANLYEKGLTDPAGQVVIAPNHQQAMAMYYLASSNNFGDAEYSLADYLVKEKKTGLSVAAKQNRSKLIKRLYEGAVKNGIAEAVLPLAFYNAMDSDTSKQKQAFEVAKKEAQAGNSEAALLLGMMYERGISVPADPVEAMYWYQKAALNPVSAFILGTYYAEGKSLSKDAPKGRELLQQSADAGFGYANLNLAILQHQEGQDFLTELDKARQLGNSKAGLLLADYYLLEANDPDKMKQAADIYQFFAEKGDKDAQMKLGFLFDRGLGGQANTELAAQWYTSAAEQGQPLAQYLLGQLYQLGKISKEPDYVEAKKWFNAALTGYPQAAVALGFIYDTVDNDYLNAEKNYNLAANAGDAIGRYNLGLLYENGKGIPVDNQKAQALYLEAANQGYPNAMTQLAELYFKGVKGERNEEEALNWYKKAASLGESGAMYQLGLLSETGVATPLDLAAALKYYQQAADLGNEKAKMALARMYQYGLGVEKDPQHAADIYKELSATSNAYAQFQLAVMYLDGTLGERQLEQGKGLLRQARDNGYKQAGIMMQWLNAQQEQRLSFIEPVILNHAPVLAGQSADLMYLDALSEWNRGNETLSRMILNRIMSQFPQYAPAKRAYEQLNQQGKATIIFG